MAGSTGITIALPDEEGLEISLSEPLTQEEFVQFCRNNPDLQAEREPNGKIWIMPPVNLDSGYHEGEVFAELRNFSKRDGRGRAFSPSTGFYLPDGSTRSADASWVSWEKLNPLTPAQRKTFPPLVPDFIIEVRSQSDSLPRLKRKMKDIWMANGVSLAWLIDPKEQKTYIYRADGSEEIIAGFDQQLNGENVLPGFILDLGLLVD